MTLLFPHRVKRTDVYHAVDYGRGEDLARASKQPVKMAEGVRVGRVEVTNNGHDYVKEPDGKVFVVTVLEYGGQAAVERFADEAEAMAAHDRGVAELKGRYVLDE